MAALIRQRAPVWMLALLMAGAGAQASAGQSGPAPAPAATPNLSGVWNVSGGRGQENAASSAFKESQWTTEPLPFTPSGRALFLAHKPGKGPRMVGAAVGNDPIGGANPPGLYRTLIYGRPFEFLQVPGKIVQTFEWGRVWRDIYVDGRPVPEDVPTGPFWYGYSVGHWEGDTLVVSTLALDGRAWFDEWGTPISDDARVEERWRRTGPDSMQLTVTVRDPAIYSKPWTSSAVTFRTARKGVEPGEIIMAPMDENTFNERIRDPAGASSR